MIFRNSVDEFKTEKEKYLSGNIIQRFLINKFLSDLDETLESLLSTNLLVLDAGCGIGITIRHLKKYNKNLNIAGLDLLLKSLIYAQKLNEDVTFFNANLYNMPFRDNSLDIVISTETLEHLENPERALKEIKRVAKKYCIICVPYEPFFSIANLLRFKYLKTLGNYPGHIYKWDIKQFKKLLNIHFKKINIKISALWIIASCEK